MQALRVNQSDNVATLLVDCKKNQSVELDGLSIVLLEDIKSGHKFALNDIAKGGHIIKYCEPIGLASRDIKKGEWVHIHNIEGIRGRGDQE